MLLPSATYIDWPWVVHAPDVGHVQVLFEADDLAPHAPITVQKVNKMSGSQYGQYCRLTLAKLDIYKPVKPGIRVLF